MDCQGTVLLRSWGWQREFLDSLIVFPFSPAFVQRLRNEFFAL